MDGWLTIFFERSCPVELGQIGLEDQDPYISFDVLSHIVESVFMPISPWVGCSGKGVLWSCWKGRHIGCDYDESIFLTSSLSKSIFLSQNPLSSTEPQPF